MNTRCVPPEWTDTTIKTGLDPLGMQNASVARLSGARVIGVCRPKQRQRGMAEDFERDFPVELRIACAVDRPVGAAPEQVDDRQRAELRAGGQSIALRWRRIGGAGAEAASECGQLAQPGHQGRIQRGLDLGPVDRLSVRDALGPLQQRIVRGDPVGAVVKARGMGHGARGQRAIGR